MRRKLISRWAYMHIIDINLAVAALAGQALILIASFTNRSARSSASLVIIVVLLLSIIY